jgi:phosphohistidine phosphatase SixA
MGSAKCRMLVGTLGLLLAAAALSAQTISRDNLAAALRDGGFVIVMRHANSPRSPPDDASTNPDNTGHERQLDAAGRRDASAMGAALTRLKIPVNEILSSPTYRALETARLIGAGKVRPMEELSNEGMAATSEARAAWLRKEVGRKTESGGNRVLITHGPNIAAAFPRYSADMGEGEALIFDPRGMEGPVMIQRIKIADWEAL